ncbi:hypothetical protein PAXRUDRAFT_145715 [Paxillus rubicundulus Ve08.2h10]|uniref:Unplaced genomic scaffold scaffold_388, whole genome shotgun sequence n=1 Tax=Paxillus rubicundulus Ve08.2h10 TaxID=930991 RepID=A0A0D0DN12_9AGAM|nr:hypothetical protein PAXRUDRAFT_145715 [Paxillus rubicundulus Ve08.2h10]
MTHFFRPLPSLHTVTATIIDLPTHDSTAWSIMLEFANGVIHTLPDHENQLHHHFDKCYNFADWKPVIDAIFGAENDTSQAAITVNELHDRAQVGPCTAQLINHPAPYIPLSPQPTLQL